jgi:mannose-1-phosphate guanylyltransferase
MRAVTDHGWAIVLAAGEGSRLRDLTTTADGTAIPKQFCSLFGERSLLDDAMERAQRVIGAEHSCAIVAHQHRRWWSQSDAVKGLPPGNLFLQPANRGTGIGILYSLLHVLNQDPDAHVILLPADHYVDSESILIQVLHAAMHRLERNDERLVLLGMDPDEPDTELGYIIPGQVDALGGHTVARFVEKPSFAAAREMVDRGALCNTFIIAAAARKILQMLMPRFASVVVEMQSAVLRLLTSPHHAWTALVDLYGRLPQVDFSRDVLQHEIGSLCVLRVPACGWNDLGTLRRVGQTLKRVNRECPSDIDSARGYLTLASQYRRLEGSRRPAA